MLSITSGPYNIGKIGEKARAHAGPHPTSAKPYSPFIATLYSFERYTPATISGQQDFDQLERALARCLA
jgi:hypothetical protein